MASLIKRDEHWEKIVAPESIPYDERVMADPSTHELTERMMALYPKVVLSDPSLSGELGFWIRIFAHRLLLVEKADVDLAAKYLGVKPGHMSTLYTHMRRGATRFAQFFFEHIAQEPHLYTAPGLIERIRAYGRRLDTVLPYARPEHPLEAHEATRLQAPHARVRVWPAPGTIAVDAFRRVEAKGPLRDALMASVPTVEALAPVAKAMVAAAAPKPTADELFALESADNNIGKAVLGYLQTTLKTLAVQSIFMRDEHWLRMQRAGDLAQLHTAMASHALRLVEALAQAQSPGEPVVGEVVSEADDVFAD